MPVLANQVGYIRNKKIVCRFFMCDDGIHYVFFFFFVLF